MPRRKPRIEPLASANFEVVIDYHNEAGQWMSWFIRNRESCAETRPFTDWESYYDLKRTWRRSKLDFESMCRFMKFGDLFSTAGVEL